MSANAATLNITIDLNSKKGKDAFDSLKKDVKGFEGNAKASLNNVDKAAKNTGNSFLSLSNIIKGAGIASLAGMAVAAVKGAAELENYGVQFEVLTGSAEKGKKLFEDIRTMGAKTPFETKDLAASANMMLANNVAVEQILPNMDMLSNVAAGNAQKLDTLTRAFSRVQSQGKATGETINMMIDTGFNPLTIISEKTGKSMSELQKDMEAGRISADQITDAFKTATSEGGKFAGMNEKMSMTFDGMLSTLKDTIGALMSEAGKPILKLLKDLMPVITPIVEQLGKWLVPIFGELAKVIKVLLPPFMELFQKIFKAAQPIIATVFQVMNRLAPVFGRMATAVGALIPALQPLIDVFLELVNENLDKLIPLLNVLTQALIDLTPAISLAAQFTANLIRVGAAMVNTLVNPLVNGIKYIIEKGAEAAGWIASIFGGDAAKKVNQAGASTYAGGGTKGVGVQAVAGDGGGKPKPPPGAPPKPGDGKAAAKAREEADKLLLEQRERLEETAKMWREYDAERAEARKKADEEMKKLEGESFAREALKRAAESARIEEKERKEMESMDRIQMMKAENIDSDIERERELLRVKLDMLANEFMSEEEYALKRKALENETQKNIQNIQKSQLDSGFAYAQETLGLMSELAAENFEDQKAVSMAQAAVNGAVGITKVLDQFGVFGIPLAALIAAATAKQLAVIQKTKPAKAREGGGMMDPSEKYHVNESGRSEFLMNAGATQRNRGALEAMNAGATIGSLTGATPISPPNAIGRGSNVNLSGEFRFQDGALKMQLEKELKLEQGSMVA